jgi:hypothetical protein
MDDINIGSRRKWHSICLHLFWGWDNTLELAQKDLRAHSRIKFFDSLGDLLGRQLFNALNEDFFGPESDIR